MNSIYKLYDESIIIKNNNLSIALMKLCTMIYVLDIVLLCVLPPYRD